MIYLAVGVFFLCLWANMKGLKRWNELKEDIIEINQVHNDNQ